MEIWKDIQGYEGLYQVRNLGNVRRSKQVATCRLLNPYANSYGYLTVGLSKNGVVSREMVHRLVANAFIENPFDFPCINHKDECKSNNEVSNLEWCDKSYNNRYGTHPMKISEANSKPVLQILNGNVVRTWKSCSEAALMGGYTVSCISRCCLGERKVHKGYDPGAADGIVGGKTQAAIKQFQADFGGIGVDGIAGEETQKALKHAVAYGTLKRENATENATVSKTETVTGTFWDEIEYFERKEFRCPCGKCGGFPVEPQEVLVRAVNQMRKDFGTAIIIVPPDGHSGGSGVRCQAYNDSLSGVCQKLPARPGQGCGLPSPRPDHGTGGILPC